MELFVHKRPIKHDNASIWTSSLSVGDNFWGVSGSQEDFRHRCMQYRFIKYQKYFLPNASEVTITHKTKDSISILDWNNEGRRPLWHHSTIASWKLRKQHRRVSSWQQWSSFRADRGGSYCCCCGDDGSFRHWRGSSCRLEDEGSNGAVDEKLLQQSGQPDQSHKKGQEGQGRGNHLKGLENGLGEHMHNSPIYNECQTQ